MKAGIVAALDRTIIRWQKWRARIVWRGEEKEKRWERRRLRRMLAVVDVDLVASRGLSALSVRGGGGGAVRHGLPIANPYIQHAEKLFATTTFKRIHRIVQSSLEGGRGCWLAGARPPLLVHFMAASCFYTWRIQGYLSVVVLMPHVGATAPIASGKSRTVK